MKGLFFLSAAVAVAASSGVTVQSADTGTRAAREHVRRVKADRVTGEPAVFFAGDSSLVWRRPDAYGGSWGEKLRPCIRKNVLVYNRSAHNASTESFIARGYWDKLLKDVWPGDMVLIQFGLIDRSSATNRHVAIDRYADNLGRMAADVKAKGALPVFVTPVAQRLFTGDGKPRTNAAMEKYAGKMRSVAAETGTECIDMYSLTLAKNGEAGDTASRKWYLVGVRPPDQPRDNTHLSKEGARVFAEAFLAQVRGKFPAVAAYFAPPGGEKPRDIPVNLKRPVKLTPEAQAFFDRLRDAPKSGKFYFSWLSPWCNVRRAYDLRHTNCWFRTADGEYRPRSVKEAEPGPSTVSKFAEGYVPLVYFLEFGDIAGTYFGKEFYERNRAGLEALVKTAYHRWGAVPVFSWHADNPYTPNRPSFPKYGTGSMFRYRYTYAGYPQEHRYVVREILDGTGGECGGGRNINMWRFTKPDDPIETWPTPRAWFSSRLDEIADFIGRLKDERGRPIPLVVRLWHECEDDWHWWGRGSATRDEYVKFFRYTVDEIRRRTGGGAQLLFLYSPDRNWITLGDADSKDDFMYRYPGDGYVDIMGFDDYSIGKPPKNKAGEFDFGYPDLRKYVNERLDITIRKMRFVTAEAERRGKACGIIETGFRKSLDDGFDFLMRAMTADGCRFGLVNIWGGQNVPHTPDGIDCFRKFLADPRVLLEKNAR